MRPRRRLAVERDIDGHVSGGDFRCTTARPQPRTSARLSQHHLPGLSAMLKQALTNRSLTSLKRTRGWLPVCAVCRVQHSLADLKQGHGRAS